MKGRRDTKNIMFLGTLLVVQILVFVLVLLSAYTVSNRIFDYTQESSKEQALRLSKDRMKERIESALVMIETEREQTLSEVHTLGEMTAAHVSAESYGDMGQQLTELQTTLSKSVYGQALQMLLYDTSARTTLLFADGTRENVTGQFEDLREMERFVWRSPYYQRVFRGTQVLYIFAEQEDLDTISKSRIHDMIHRTRYGEEGYVWVNEILNYDGGEHYAIRLIHPNLKETEGQYLSTETTDVSGGYSYRTELEGIKRDGEVFHTYYFKKMSDGTMTEKASYAKLYKPFNWIVATGDPFDTIFAYAEEQEESSRQMFADSARSIVIYFGLLFLADVAVIVLSNRRHKKKETLEAQMRADQNRKLFTVVAQHSNRTLYEFDLATGTTRPWSEVNEESDLFAHLYAGRYSEAAVEKNPWLLPDSLDAVKEFFAGIYDGVPDGNANVHLRLRNEEQRWYHFCYSTIFENEVPKTALISVEDTTERHAHELSYLRYAQTKGDTQENHLLEIECDLTGDLVESLSGQLLSEEEQRKARGEYSTLRREFLNLKFRYEDFVESSKYFSRENLLKLYAQGERKLNRDWKARFNDFTVHWLATEVVLVEDPYNGHVKASICMWDVTEERDEHQAILHRADYDVMTGLLRKDVGEARIRKHLEAKSAKGGILIALDLDDLKGINDVLGHRQGDRAISGIANTLKNHFRNDDVLVRAGGDEFIVFLPGAAKGIESVERSVSALTKKLSSIFVGEKDERRIHCSIGCAIQKQGDTFDTLFNRADKALYHVKRNGKNNFAFYIPEMEQADYIFRAKTVLSSRNDEKFDLPEVRQLIDSMIQFYQLVLSVNVSKNTYHMMEEVKDGVFARVPAFGSLDGFVELASKPVHADDLQGYLAKVSRDALAEAYERGETSVRHSFRFFHQGRYRWIECLIMFYLNDRKEVCDFTLLRWADGAEGEATGETP